MKKILLVIVTILSIVLVGKVSAESALDEELKVLTLEATMEGTKITAKGTTSSNMLAVSVLVYDESGQNFIKMESGQVDDGNYSVTLDGFDSSKKYMVRVANYDSGDFLEQLVSIENKPNTPNTGDSVINYIVISALSVISLISIVFYRKRLN